MSDVVIQFPAGFDERARSEHEMKGWLAGVTVRLARDGQFVPVTFVDSARLAQELTENSARGKPWVVEPNLIVVERVTEEIMRRAIMDAVAEGAVVSGDRL